MVSLSRIVQSTNMKSQANYQILENTAEHIILQDMGPWDKYMTITNAAESVIASLSNIGSRRVFYYDSEDVLTELLVKDGKFAGFAPVKENHGNRKG